VNIASNINFSDSESEQEDDSISSNVSGSEEEGDQEIQINSNLDSSSSQTGSGSGSETESVISEHAASDNDSEELACLDEENRDKIQELRQKLNKKPVKENPGIFLFMWKHFITLQRRGEFCRKTCCFLEGFIRGRKSAFTQTLVFSNQIPELLAILKSTEDEIAR
jgi:hypothetical protein